jgi:hypothetical protein
VICCKNGTKSWYKSHKPVMVSRPMAWYNEE